MLPLSELFVRSYVLVDDALKSGVVAVPRRPGPPSGCSDAEVLTVALVRRVLGRPSEAGVLAEVRRNWRHYFPALPAQSEFNRRVRWLWGAFEALRRRLVAGVPADGWQQADTSALPVKHPSRVRAADGWQGPNGLVAGLGRDAAHGEWFYGFRLALRTDLGSRLVRSWGLVPAAVDERAVADWLLESAPVPAGLLLNRGLLGRAWAAGHEVRGTRVAYAHGRADRQRLPRALRRPVAALRNRIETTTGEITEQLGLAHHRAHTVRGLLARTAATILAHILIRLALV
jgi:DDE family transposase